MEKHCIPSPEPAPENDFNPGGEGAYQKVGPVLVRLRDEQKTFS